jgi:predicted secreted protein
MGAVIGNNVMLYYHRTDVDPEEDVAFACSTTCAFQVSVDQKEVTSQTSAWFREYKNDIATWSVTCDGLITLTGFSYLFMLNKQLTREPIEIKFVVDNGVDGLTIINGTCNISSLAINAPQKDVATYNISLQGSGAYNTTGTEVNPEGIIIVGANPVLTKGYTAAGGETTVTFADAIGYTCLYVSRGGIDAQNIITSGTPTGDNVKFLSSTGVLTFSRALETGEFIRGLFQ